MAKIDYQNYIAQLGQIETDAKGRIKKYLEELCDKDEVIKTLYRPEKIDECYDFIIEAVKNMQRSGICACVEGAVVFKMARDFYIEILPKTADTPPEIKPVTLKQSAASEVSKEMDKDIEKAETEPQNEKLEIAAVEEDNIVRDLYGFEVFGEEPEKQEKEPCHQEENKDKDNVFLDGQAYNAGDIIDKIGRELKEEEMIVGQRFIAETDNEYVLSHVVCVVAYKDPCGSIRYETGGESQYIFKNGFNNKEFYAVPSDALVIGKYDRKSQRTMYEKSDWSKAQKETDDEGNFLLFGF